jgi:RimJ/RimL family protein N-acetyltransferase
MAALAAGPLRSRMTPTRTRGRNGVGLLDYACEPGMAKKPPHPILSTRRLRLRQFRAEDADAMHRCFTDAEAMRFWNHPVHTKPIETDRAVRRCIDCTPSY